MIEIDTQSKVTLAFQIYQTLKGAIVSEKITSGQGLPSACQVGADLGIHFNTVARAYRELAREGILFVAHGRKTYVRDMKDVSKRATEQDRQEVRRMFRDAITQAKLSGWRLGSFF